MHVVYMDKPKSACYRPIVDDNGQHGYGVLIVTRKGGGLAAFSKGFHIQHTPPNPFTPVDGLSEGSIVIFDERLYRQEPEVKGKGIEAILLRYC